MSATQSIVEEVQGLLAESQKGMLSPSQFETRRSTLLLAAEADLINRREMLLNGIASGTISGLDAADSRAEMERSEQELREAASMVGVTRASAAAGPSCQTSKSSGSPQSAKREETPLCMEEAPTLGLEKVGRVKFRRSLISLDRPEMGFLARRVGAVFPTVSGALVFAPVGVLILMGKIEGWAAVWGVVMLMLSLACVLSARERWENPGPT